MNHDIQTAANAIRDRLNAAFPKTVLVLGSGLGEFGDKIDIEAIIPYGEIPGFPVSTVSGHSGKLLIGTASAVPVACMQGRLHVYEGHPIQQVALPIRTFRALGAETLILTNAAGSLKKEMGPGSLMVIEDHINASGRNPLIGENDEKIGLRFPDMSEVYAPELREKLLSAGTSEALDLSTGTYLYTTGPSFETPAEVRMFAKCGADAVGMSTVPEAIAAIHCGLKVAGVSLITNHAAGIAAHKITHDETLSVGALSFEKMSRLILRFLPSIN
ncbi:purine-nucleoside phosphorylase [Hyphococcus flavus]|uniref:Purine nucleoside phosphorylase n=1 Tax=Hyphococcus flavus TaxID=1866326 RepID=A0AAE9ZCP7_9PROT|nr:purine-nucleoside phosphorylase [Hyphococcus flavus]WDI30168.1 purine-nucleoside phosphorylase [Hyphococcus flavus]